MQAKCLIPGEKRTWTADGTYSNGDVIQLDGRAAVLCADAVSGQQVGVYVSGKFEITKTTSMVLLIGGRAYWDYSASKVHYKKVNDRDFFAGMVLEDAASAATVCYVDLNVWPVADIDLFRDGFQTVATGTQALGGFLPPQPAGGGYSLRITGTSEVQKVDMLSVDRFAIGANAIAEFVFRLGTNGSTSDVDINFGLASATHATDADSIANHCFFHIDGGALTINAQSKDPSTTVAATTTGVSATADDEVADRVECWIDTRELDNVKLYVNGARVASGSTFKLDAANAALGLLAHVEKVTGTATAGPIFFDRAEARFLND